MVSSSKITTRFKTYILEMVCRHLRDKLHDDEHQSLNKVLMRSILRNGIHNKLDCEYLDILYDCYQDVDDVIQFELEEFSTLMVSERRECEQA